MKAIHLLWLNRLAKVATTFVPLVLLLLAKITSHGATISEDFTTDPLTRGWRVFGNSNLFTFNQAAKNLGVTWDSSRSNSYYYVLLNNILTRQDDFGLALDLELTDVTGGVNSNKPSTFELAVGFMNIVDAAKTNFFRGNSSYSPDLIEFDFFPDTGFGPTIWPSIWSTNSSLNYNGTGDYTILPLPTGVVMRLTMSYAASNRTLTTSISTNGISIGAISSVTLSSTFSDFRVNAFAVESYSDVGQDPRYGGSLLAHGRVDNVLLSMPLPPVQNLALTAVAQQWQVSFISRTNWLYTLERSTDLLSWLSASTMTAGNGATISWPDTNALASRAFYRVRAERP
jgi:hypothetical protein